MNERGKEELQAALAGLAAAVGEIVTAVEERSGTVCPYKTAKQKCTFGGGCDSQLRWPGEVRCGGDEFFQWVGK